MLPSSLDEFNYQLQKLALEAVQHPAQSRQRQIALNHLIKQICRSDQLGYPQSAYWTSNVYEDLYNEALQRTLEEVVRKIDGYNPAHPVMAWVNFLLKCHFRAVARDYLNRRINFVSLDDLDLLITDESKSSVVEHLRQFLEEDPENYLKMVHIKGHPEVTFQSLALARCVEDQSWEKLSAELGIPIQTLCSFFNRQLRKLTPYFQRCLQE